MYFNNNNNNNNNNNKSIFIIILGVLNEKKCKITKEFYVINY